MTHWHTTVTYDGTIDQDQAHDVAGRGGFTLVTVDRTPERPRTTIAFGVQAGTIRQATDAAHRQARDLTAGIAVGAAVAVRVVTDDELAVELERPQIPELVDSTAARELLGGISQQRLSELLRTNAEFPEPVQTFAGGRHVWVKTAIEAFGQRERKPGRPPKTTP